MRQLIWVTSAVTVLSMALPGAPASAATINWGDASSVVISEIGCDAQAGEFVELQNIDSVRPVSLAGWVVTDKALDNDELNHDYKFGTTAKIAAGAYLILRAGLNGKLPFGIGCADDSIRLAASVNGKLVLSEEVAVPNLADGFTWSRFITSSKVWQASTPTAGAANIVAPEGSVVDRAAFLYDPELEHDINITLTSANRIELDKQTRDNHRIYIPAKFSMTTSTGERFPATGALDVGIRLKGSVGSFCPLSQKVPEDCLKPAFKLKFDAFVAGQRFFWPQKNDSQQHGPRPNHDKSGNGLSTF